MSLQLGSNLFDVAASYGTTLARPSDLPDQKPESQEPSKTGSTFLCVAVGSERVLLTEGPIAGHLSLVPTSMTSATHLELAKHVGQQHVKHSRMKILDDSVEADTLAKMQRESAGKAVVAKPRVRREPGMGGTSRRNRSRRAKSEDSGSDRGYRRERDYDEDDGFVVADDDEEEAEETEDEDDAAWGSKKSKSKKSKKSKKRRGSESLDELELADRRLEARDRERKRAKKDKAKSRDYVDSEEDDDDVDDAEIEAGEEDSDVDMDVESEDD